MRGVGDVHLRNAGSGSTLISDDVVDRPIRDIRAAMLGGLARQAARGPWRDAGL